MKSREPRDPEAHFEETWKRWLQRPTALSPAEAAGRIAGHLSPRRRRKSAWLVAAAASILLLAAGIAIWRTTTVLAPGEPPFAAPEKLGGGEVLMWLDSQTPLYMTFQAEALNPNGGEK
jgi:hypothetical protein